MSMDNLVFLPEITGDGISIEKVHLHWTLPDESIVNKGDVIMEVNTKLGNIYPLVAHMSGMFIRFWSDNLTIEKSKYEEQEFKIADAPKVCVGVIFRSYEDYITSFFKYKAKVDVDSFTKEKTINWVYVAEPIINLPYITGKRYNSFRPLICSKNNLKRKDVARGICGFRKVINISNYCSLGISFSFVYSEGNSYIEFSYSQDKIKLKRNDTISFLYDNGNISDFKLRNSPFKISEKSKTRYIKCQLYEEDIDNLTNSLISKWKISFADEQIPSFLEDIVPAKEKVEIPHISLVMDQYFNLADCLKRAKRTPFLIQNYTKYYVKVLKKEVPDYEHPTKEIKGDSLDSGTIKFDWCYVYLMKDFSNNYYKIGMSKTPDYRERTLQSEKPTIEMICNKRLSSRRIAEAFEKALHHAFADKRIRGEWFNLNEIDVAEIVESLK